MAAGRNHRRNHQGRRPPMASLPEARRPRERRAMDGPERTMGRSEPMSSDSWEPEVRDLQRRTEMAHRMGGAEKVERHRSQGKLTVRERIDALLDPGSFHEIGVLAGRPT